VCRAVADVLDDLPGGVRREQVTSRVECDAHPLEGACQLDLPERVRERILEERPRPVRRPGVVDDQPDLEPLGGGRHPGAEARIGEVERERADLDAMACADFRGNAVEQRLVPCDQDEVKPAAGRLVRDGRADPLRCPGDDGPPAVLAAELAHSALLIC